MPRTPEAQRRFERAAADHRARRRLVLDSDLENDNSNSLPELNTNVEDPFVENDDMALIQLSLHSSLNAETEPGMNEKLQIWQNVPVVEADGPWAVPLGLHSYTFDNKYSDRIHVNPLKRNLKFGREHFDSIQHFKKCPNMIYYTAYPREVPCLYDLPRKFTLCISTSYDGENDIIMSVALRTTVSKKIYHYVMKYALTLIAKKFYMYYAAARLALRPHAVMSVGAVRASVPRCG